MIDDLITTTTSDFHGEVWSLNSVLDHNYYSLSNENNSCKSHGEEGCTKDNQWGKTLVASSKSANEMPDLCVCLLKQTEVDENIGSKYCPEMFIENDHWEVDTTIEPGRYYWCIQSNGEECEQGQQIPYVTPDDSIDTKEECRDYMRKNYPETDFTTFHPLENGVMECKGYVNSDDPKEINAEPGRGWYTLPSHKKRGEATAINMVDWNGNKSYIEADECSTSTDFHSNGRKHYWKNSSTTQLHAGSPADCSKFRIYGNEPMFEANCKYPGNAIPTREAAKALIDDSKGIQNAPQFLANYCFQSETENKSSQYDTAPRALTILNLDDKDICTRFREEFPNEYDSAAHQYCQKIYDIHKNDPSFDYTKTGCQCFIDTKINISTKLERVTTALQASPHCVWAPCDEKGDQLVPVIGVTDRECPADVCSNIVTILSEADIENVEFVQNIMCDLDDGSGGSDGSDGPKKKNSDTTRGIIMLIIVGAIVLVSIIGISIYYFK